jgi:hypothetical protein
MIVKGLLGREPGGVGKEKRKDNWGKYDQSYILK